MRGETQDTGSIYDSEGVDPDDSASVEVPESNFEELDKDDVPAGSLTSVQPSSVNTTSNSASEKFNLKCNHVHGPTRKKLCQDLNLSKQEELEIAIMEEKYYVEALKIEREILREKLKMAQIQREAAVEKGRLRKEILKIQLEK